MTLLLDAEDQGWFDRKRAAYFPAARNYLAAHVTLFHHLPAEEAVAADLGEVAGDTGRFDVRVIGVRSLGRGAAYVLESTDLMALRGRLAARWEAVLSAQDRQGFRPHVTVQNKVTPEEARRVLAQLAGEFVPFVVAGIGLGLWRYRGRPWEAAGRFAFRDR